MVLENLGESLKNTLDKITRSIFVDETLINELVKDIQRALLQSDVNVRLVFQLTKKIKERALKEDAPAGLTKKEYLVKIVYDELVAFLGEKESKIEISAKPTNIMLVGLFGNGKTTTAGKLAKYFLKRGMKVALVQTDTWRPAALDQLQQLGQQINAPVFGMKTEKDPVKIYQTYKEELSKFDIVIVDTAGRDALNDELIQELDGIASAVKPSEVLLVIGADIGQAAETQVAKFHETCKVTGVIITKMEGTAKGGGALTACAVTGSAVKFIGVGEKLEDFEKFNPEGFVGRLLGMGDLEALLEKARGAISEEDAEDLSKRFLKGEFNLIDLYEQMEAMNKMGPLTKVMEMIPGMGSLKLPKDMLKIQEGKLKKWRHAMNSMSKGELEDPDTISANRIERIAKGSGVSAGEIRELLKQYKQSKKMVKMLKGANPKNMDKMMKRMGGMQGMKFG